MQECDDMLTHFKKWMNHLLVRTAEKSIENAAIKMTENQISEFVDDHFSKINLL